MESKVSFGDGRKCYNLQLRSTSHLVEKGHMKVKNTLQAEGEHLVEISDVDEHIVALKRISYLCVLAILNMDPSIYLLELVVELFLTRGE